MRQVRKTKVVSYHFKEVLVHTKHTTHPPPQLAYQGYYGSLEAFLRQVKKIKAVSYHLKEVLVPTMHTNPPNPPTLTTGLPRVLGQFRGFSEAS